jgi:hypothetical protein
MNKKAPPIILIWAITASAIILQALYVQPLLTWHHYLFLFIASILPGILLADLKEIIIGYFIMCLLSLFIMTFSLAILPVISGKVPPIPSLIDMLLQSALITIFRSTLPSVWILCLISAILGSAIAEYLKITDAP